MLKGSCAYRSVLGVALVSLLLGLSVEAFFDYGRDFRGPYCRKYGSCCDSRKDDCGVPIAGMCVDSDNRHHLENLSAIGPFQIPSAIVTSSAIEVIDPTAVQTMNHFAWASNRRRRISQ